MADGLEEIDALKKNWKTDELRRFLKEREINCGGNKEELAKKVFWATKLDIKPAPTKAEELLEITKSRETKLMVDNGIKLPFPEELKSGWEADNWLLFPQTCEEEVEEFLKGVFKAQDKGAGLLVSNHLSNVKSHVISQNVRYCFVAAECTPEERLHNAPYNVWVCLHKDTGKVISAECTCIAGWVVLISQTFYVRI